MNEENVPLHFIKRKSVLSFFQEEDEEKGGGGEGKKKEKKRRCDHPLTPHPLSTH